MGRLRCIKFLLFAFNFVFWFNQLKRERLGLIRLAWLGQLQVVLLLLARGCWVQPAGSGVNN
ncbi:hypothetical protein UY3_13092 [Chelonia mydas]|uniref:Uncharacterized protein n=1 Tax=Chelonia mydas TaxID=8469 RepID=M7AYH7_CHEMY|nr:hypothetical protein UY3_13092 [Chelonia mydas]